MFLLHEACSNLSVNLYGHEFFLVTRMVTRFFPQAGAAAAALQEQLKHAEGAPLTLNPTPE